MSNSIDINDKVWGRPIRHHFFIYCIANAFIASTLLISVVDYLRLPSNAPSAASAVFFGCVIVVCIRLLEGSMKLLLLLCPNKIYYGLLALFMFFVYIANAILDIHTNLTTSQTQSFANSEQAEMIRKYYLFGFWAGAFQAYALTVLRIYFVVFLFYLGFYYTPKPKVDLYTVEIQPTPSQEPAGEGGEEGDSDEDGKKEEQKVCSRRSSRRAKKMSNSSKSAEKSDKSGKSDKSAKKIVVY